MAHFTKTRLAIGIAALAPVFAFANPSDGTVVSGEVTIGGRAGAMVVTQTSNNAVVNWNSFSVGANESVQFQQPGASATILNRVTGNSASTILGNISSNGRVFLVNPRGVVFGQGAEVNVGSLVVSTLDISNADFNAGNYAFRQGANSAAGIQNNGTIIADDGSVMLLADHVANNGLIRADAGVIALHAGSALTVSFDEDGLIGYSIGANADGVGAASSATAGVRNSGQLQANGGAVYMTALVARSVIQSVVNNTGTIAANAMEEGPDGAIILTAAGGDLTISGDISGGTVAMISSHNVRKTSNDYLTVYADSLNVIAGNSINLASDGTEGGYSYLDVGDGYAFGFDQSLMQQLQQQYPDLAPASLAPNAAFQAGNQVALGEMYIDGGYLFVRATGLSAEHISTEGNLFYNFRPVNNTDDIGVVQSGYLPFSASSITLAYGGSDYNGNIEVSAVTPADTVAKLSDGIATIPASDVNYVFMSNGEVHGTDSLSTSGVIAVLNGATTSDGEHPSPDDQITAAELAAVTSNTADTIGYDSLHFTSDDETAVAHEDDTTQQCQ